jgi:hypothetical protein
VPATSKLRAVIESQILFVARFFFYTVLFATFIHIESCDRVEFIEVIEREKKPSSGMKFIYNDVSTGWQFRRWLAHDVHDFVVTHPEFDFFESCGINLACLACDQRIFRCVVWPVCMSFSPTRMPESQTKAYQ